MVHLPKLPDPESAFSVIDRASGVIDKGLGFIDKVSDRLDRLGITEESPPTTTTAPVAQKEAPPEQKPTPTITPQEPAVPQQEEIATACVPCSLGHFSTCAGLLNEAMRFKKDGLTSNQVTDDIGKSIMELNALERVDLTPEKIQRTKGWERPIAEDALQQSRNFRHRLEKVENMEELEQIAADTQRYYTQLNRQWYKGRFGHLGDRKAEAIAQRVGGE